MSRRRGAKSPAATSPSPASRLRTIISVSLAEPETQPPDPGVKFNLRLRHVRSLRRDGQENVHAVGGGQGRGLEPELDRSLGRQLAHDRRVIDPPSLDEVIRPRPNRPPSLSVKRAPAFNEIACAGPSKSS